MNINEIIKQILRKECAMLMSFYVVPVEGELDEKQLKINYFIEEKINELEEEIQKLNELKKYTEFIGYISQEECGYDAGKTILYDAPYPMTLREAQKYIKKNKIKQDDLLIGDLTKGTKEYEYEDEYEDEYEEEEYEDEEEMEDWMAKQRHKEDMEINLL